MDLRKSQREQDLEASLQRARKLLRELPPESEARSLLLASVIWGEALLAQSRRQSL